jgi:hypothetical protein
VNNVIVCPECGYTNHLRELRRSASDPDWLVALVCMWPAFATTLVGALSVPFDIAVHAMNAPADRLPSWVSPMSVYGGATFLTLAFVLLYHHAVRKRRMNANWWLAFLLSLPINVASPFLVLVLFMYFHPNLIRM